MRKTVLASVMVCLLALPGLLLAQASSPEEYILKTYWAVTEPDFDEVYEQFTQPVVPLPTLNPGTEPILVTYPEFLVFLYEERLCPVWDEYGPENETCQEALERLLEAFDNKVQLAYLSWVDFYNSKEAEYYRNSQLGTIMTARPMLARYLADRARAK